MHRVHVRMAMARARHSTPGAVVVPLPTARRTATQLVQGLRAGDERAAREMVERYGPELRRVVSRVVGALPELEDVLHETFLRALERIDGLRQPDRLKSWLFGIAIRVAREHLRKGRGRVVLADRELPEVAAPAVDHEAAQTLARVEATLRRLPADERAAFALRYMEGMELREVAEAVGCSLATVKRRLRRAAMSFEELAADDPLLGPRLRSGDRFGEAAR